MDWLINYVDYSCGGLSCFAHTKSNVQQQQSLYNHLKNVVYSSHYAGHQKPLMLYMLFYHTRLPTCNYYASTEMLLCKYFCSLLLQERGFRILFLISDLANLYYLSVSLNMAHNMISCLCFFFFLLPLTYRLY